MKIFFTEHFKHQLKKLQRKYPHVRDDILMMVKNLNSDIGIPIGHSIYKIRIKSSDLQKGKSGGFRAYLYCLKQRDLVVPLCIYAKSETESITESTLQYHFDQGLKELIAGLGL